MLPELDRDPRFARPLKELERLSDLLKPLAIIACYAGWILLLRLLFLSFLVYFLTRQGHRPSFEEINEAFATNELPFIGLASAGFVLILKGLAPLIDRAGELRFSLRPLRANFLPGALRGTVLGASFIAAFLLLGTFRFVGFFIQIEDTPVAIAGIVIRVLALLSIGSSDELVFRCWRQREHLSSRVIAVRISVIGLAYCAVKLAQFELSWMHFVTLFLLSATLSVRRFSQKTFLEGAGFVAALLIVFHPMFSLPIFGSDFSGIFLLKYQQQATLPAWVSGGAGGPLSSFAFQALLLIDLVRGFLIQRAARKAAHIAAEKKALLKLSTTQ